MYPWYASGWSPPPLPSTSIEGSTSPPPLNISLVSRFNLPNREPTRRKNGFGVWPPSIRPHSVSSSDAATGGRSVPSIGGASVRAKSAASSPSRKLAAPTNKSSSSEPDSDPRLSPPDETPFTPPYPPGEDRRELVLEFDLNGRVISEPILARPDTNGLSSEPPAAFFTGTFVGDWTPIGDPPALSFLSGVEPSKSSFIRRRASRALRSTRAAARLYTP
mmetsp:Transcript_10192/g.28428  ORF Transcript_10192/g.28428 Transcript_10192/m.28428 type:complete len:219 (-) Transcript_10192:879-1535(-)